jgi:hypothetical protein
VFGAITLGLARDFERGCVADIEILLADEAAHERFNALHPLARLLLVADRSFGQLHDVRRGALQPIVWQIVVGNRLGLDVSGSQTLDRDNAFVAVALDMLLVGFRQRQRRAVGARPQRVAHRAGEFAGGQRPWRGH